MRGENMNGSSEKQLERFLKSSEKHISPDGLEEVRHYFEHGEFEMSFEGLVIELIKAGYYPDDFEYLNWKKVAMEFGLDAESVFDGDFWNNFVRWGHSYANKNEI